MSTARTGPVRPLHLDRERGPLYQGNVSSTLVRLGELFREALRLNAAAIILVHQHPSGDATPSPDGLHLRAEAIAAVKLLGIQVLDHIIVAGNTWVSRRDRGIAFPT